MLHVTILLSRKETDWTAASYPGTVEEPPQPGDYVPRKPRRRAPTVPLYVRIPAKLRARLDAAAGIQQPDDPWGKTKLLQDLVVDALFKAYPTPVPDEDKTPGVERTDIKGVRELPLPPELPATPPPPAKPRRARAHRVRHPRDRPQHKKRSRPADGH